jgi:hypothetical protein
MDNHSARRERAALVASQAQTSSQIAALQAKVERVSRAQHGPDFGPAAPAQSAVRFKQCIATETGGKCKVALTVAGERCSASPPGQRGKELQKATQLLCEDMLSDLLEGHCHGMERGRGAPEPIVLDVENRRVVVEEVKEKEEQEQEQEHQVEGNVNKLEAEIDNEADYLLVKEENHYGEEGLTIDFTEHQPAAIPVPRGSLVQNLDLSPRAEVGIAGNGSGVEGFRRRSAFTPNNVLLDSSRKGGSKQVSADRDGLFCEAGGENSTGDWSVRGRADDYRPAQEKSPAAESQAEQGPEWQNRWPVRLLGLLSPRPPKELDVKAPEQQPVLSHRLPVLPRVQTPSPHVSPTLRSSGDDLEVGLAGVEQGTCLSGFTPVTTGLEKAVCNQDYICNTSLPSEIPPTEYLHS